MHMLKNLERLPFEARRRVTKYLEELLGLHGDNVVSVFIYGSAAGRNYIHKQSDINIAVVFRRLEFQDLKKSLRLVSRGITKKIAAPLFLTRSHIETSLDVFPMEFLGMKENHVIVYGEDILSPLEIKADHLRLFCEEQIKGKLVRIRQAYLEVGLVKRGVEALLRESMRSLMPVFRNLLRLKGKAPDEEKGRALEQVCGEFGLDKDVFLSIYRGRSAYDKAGPRGAEAHFERYIEELGKLAAIVNKL